MNGKSMGLLFLVLVWGIGSLAFGLDPAPCNQNCKQITCQLILINKTQKCFAYDQLFCPPSSPIATQDPANSLTCKTDNSTKVNSYDCPFDKCSATCNGNPPPLPEEGNCPANVLKDCTATGDFAFQTKCK